MDLVALEKLLAIKEIFVNLGISRLHGVVQTALQLGQANPTKRRLETILPIDITKILGIGGVDFGYVGIEK